ncbi:MAG: hypothetical protein JKY94_09010 [Rhodobacteraceae bacterium]|nr:hypothetical protein [Paracoccaceae bacterium]
MIGLLQSQLSAGQSFVRDGGKFLNTILPSVSAAIIFDLHNEVGKSVNVVIRISSSKWPFTT